jgi:hypothetical protein
MATSLRVRQREDGAWVADHSELVADGTAYYPDLNAEVPPTLAEIRQCLFAAIEAAHPGEYTLDFDADYARDDAFKRIDRRSDELIQAGFSFEGSVFSLSVEAQVRFTAMLMLADALPYPLAINSLDDRSAVSLVSGDHTRAFCMAALGHVKGVVDTGSAQKELVRGMGETELLAYVDPR